jgi:hypothetical protein
MLLIQNVSNLHDIKIWNVSQLDIDLLSPNLLLYYFCAI